MRPSCHLQLVNPPTLDPMSADGRPHAGEDGAANSAAIRQSIRVIRVAHAEARV